jgi:5'-nucleotidase / UDP-sugar diphosphatase
LKGVQKYFIKGRNRAMIKHSYRKFLATAATATLVVGAVAPVVSASKSFTDVPDRYSEAVNFLVAHGANGFSETSFGTNKSIKRVDAAILLANVLQLDTKNAPASGFTDVPSRATGAVNALKAANITNGKTAKSFGSDSSVTRGELALWLERAFKLEGTTTHSFSDVSARYESAIKTLVAKEITNGVSQTKFGVDQTAKRGDYALFLYRAALAKEKQDGYFTLSVMHTNDTHANLADIAKRSTAIKEVRAKKPNALLLDAGDVFSGTLYFNEFLGQADLEFMNYLGYDAMTFGNHEFDLGSSEDGHKALANFVKGAKFPFVSANVDFSKDSLFTGLQHFETSNTPQDGNIYNGIIKEIDGEKVGIFGLTTEETVEISSPNDIEFLNYIDQAKKAVKAFEDQGINKIIALTHLGLDDNAEFDNDLELAKLVEGIDIIVGGHTHSTIGEPLLNEDGIEPTIIVQTGEYGKALGTLDVKFDKDGVISSYAGELINVANKAADPEVQALLKPYADQIETLKSQSIGMEAVSALDGVRDNVRTKETNLGNLITDGMLAKAKTINPNTVIALTNGGGIRDSIDTGDITMGEVLTVMPFGNSLAIMNLTGAEIKSALEHSVSQAPAASGAFLHVSGLKFSYDSTKPAGERVVSVEVKEGSSFVALNDTTSYVVATNTFTAKGGDGYDMFKKAYQEGRVSEPGFIDYEMFIDHLKTLTTVDPVTEGRIVDVSSSN